LTAPTQRVSQSALRYFPWVLLVDDLDKSDAKTTHLIALRTQEVFSTESRRPKTSEQAGTEVLVQMSMRMILASSCREDKDREEGHQLRLTAAATYRSRRLMGSTDMFLAKGVEGALAAAMEVVEKVADVLAREGNVVGVNLEVVVVAGEIDPKEERTAAVEWSMAGQGKHRRS